MSEENEIPGTNPIDGDHAYHVPVLLSEVIAGLAIDPDGVYVDCTFGGGGHSRAILEKLSSQGKLIVFDQDIAAKQNLPDDERVIFVNQNFRQLQRFLKLHKYSTVNGILADLGVSSHQFDEAERGFSIRFDAALDMRMDNRQQTTAAEVIKNYSEGELHKMFERYGEVTNAKTLAKTIVQQRSISDIRTINQFRQAISQVVKGNPNKYLAQVFQALRIEVNDEMEALKQMLQESLQVLKAGGRIAIITFHSLEDRIVKNFFKQGNFDEISDNDDVFGNRPEPPFLLITKKPLIPGAAEMKKNSRARSAKLRIAQKK